MPLELDLPEFWIVSRFWYRSMKLWSLLKKTLRMLVRPRIVLISFTMSRSLLSFYKPRCKSISSDLDTLLLKQPRKLRIMAVVPYLSALWEAIVSRTEAMIYLKCSVLSTTSLLSSCSSCSCPETKLELQIDDWLCVLWSPFNLYLVEWLAILDW